MKALKVLYWISFAICLAQLTLTLIAPFGGPLTIYYFMKNGMFQVTTDTSVYFLDSPPYVDHPAAGTLRFLNSALTSLYFISLFASALLPLFMRVNSRTKYITGISLFLSAAFFLFIGRRIWRYLVLVYLGI